MASPDLSSYEISAFTHQGKKRTYQEDAFVIGTTSSREGATARVQLPADQAGLVAVIDGMGGMGGGDLAAAFLADRWTRARPDSSSALRSQLVNDHHDLVHYALNTTTPQMGAAAVGFLITPGHGCVFHVGDCRAYLVKPEHARLLTSDDVGEGGGLSQCFGAGLFGGQPAPLKPHLLNLPPKSLRDATLVLLSDGAWDYLERDTLSRLRSETPDLATYVQRLAEVVLDDQAHDNLTVLALTATKPA